MNQAGNDYSSAGRISIKRSHLQVRGRPITTANRIIVISKTFLGQQYQVLYKQTYMTYKLTVLEIKSVEI